MAVPFEGLLLHLEALELWRREVFKILKTTILKDENTYRKAQEEKETGEKAGTQT